MSSDKNPTDAAMNALAKVASEAYSDVARPAARRVGTAVETLFKVGLAPVAILDWGFEKSKDWLHRKIEERLAQIPEDCHVAPPSHIAVPVLLQIAASVDAPELRDLYAELLLKAMDARTSSSVHPAYISLLAQMSPPEALVFLSFKQKTGGRLFSEKIRLHLRHLSPSTIEQQFEAYCDELGLSGDVLPQIWLDNLLRLGVVAFDKYSDMSLSGEDLERPPRIDATEYRHLDLTEFGQAFLLVCDPRGPVHEA